ncbi:elongation of very long chain fatty acids protein 1-like isoform X6 [Vespula maculifrons]|uniref:Elongation of very long chain fatty acids protein 1-like isoform X6 n=1 Tax=Vespula maculifrons TaxID=7453 RepID=A0ABD2CX96_VESMC
MLRYFSNGLFTTLSIFCEPIVYSTDPADMEVSLEIDFKCYVAAGEQTRMLLYSERKIVKFHFCICTTMFQPYELVGFLENITVYVLMYTYYFLSAYASSVKKVITTNS